MNQKILGTLLAFLFVGSFSAEAKAAAKKTTAKAQPISLKSALDAQTRAAQRSAPQLSVNVVEVETGKAVYGFQADLPRTIASNTKLITSALAYDKLGKDFVFETPILIRGTIEDGVLLGDVAVVGAGDPNISGRFHEADSFAIFKSWAEALARAEIRKIDGKLILATGLFDDAVIHPDWPQSQLDRWYQAPVAALSFNDNCVLVKVNPSKGTAARASLEPNLPIYRLSGKVGVTNNRKQESVMIGRPTSGDALKLSTYLVGGLIHRNTGQVDKWVPVVDPISYFEAGLRQAFSEKGLTIAGTTERVKTLAGDWKKIASHRSTLQQTLEVVNKRSQNFYAESVFKLLAARATGKSGTWEAGVAVAQDFLGKIGISKGSYTLRDGSGLSHGNRFSATQMTSLLRHMYFHKASAEYIRTLPYSGEVDLKWERRLAQAPYKGNVLAKTGQLSGVITLSGFAKAKSGKVYAFSILCNSVRANWRAMAAQDAILRALVDHG
jgi:serine-type D-Ala-D-Ala carboxypeptidase/endopeptidase (penicillin-binding protein 4)